MTDKPVVGPTEPKRGTPSSTTPRSPEQQRADHTEAGQAIRRTWAQRILDAWRALTQRRGH